MNYITTTDLRTQSSQLVNTLKRGGTVSLIHRSRIVGVIKPAILTAGPIDLEKFSKFLDEIKPEKLIPQSQREKIYRKHLLKKYGKGIS